LQAKVILPGLGNEVAKTVLVADDNPRIRKVLCHLLEAEKEYEVCAEAANGEEAIALALRHRPQLIITDLSMPVLNGLEASRELKRLMPDVPIVLFTQYWNFGTDMFRDLPFDRIVSKTDCKKLMGYVRSLIPV
jgi:CheY-like chemotaxis protein